MLIDLHFRSKSFCIKSRHPNNFLIELQKVQSWMCLKNPQFTVRCRKDGDDKARPVIIHRAILGSVERMIAILTENYAGKWSAALCFSIKVLQPGTPRFHYALCVPPPGPCGSPHARSCWCPSTLPVRIMPRGSVLHLTWLHFFWTTVWIIILRIRLCVNFPNGTYSREQLKFLSDSLFPPLGV